MIDRYGNEIKPGDKVLFVHKRRFRWDSGIEFGEVTRESSASFWIVPLRINERCRITKEEIIFNKASYTNRNDVTYHIIKLSSELNILAEEERLNFEDNLNNI